MDARPAIRPNKFTEANMEDLIELDRRISKAIARGKGIRFSDEELDLLVSVGAIEKLKSAASEALKVQAAQRQRARDERRAEEAELQTRRQPIRHPTEEETAAASRRAQRTLRRQGTTKRTSSKR
jgi:hypothetical protein